MMLQITSSYTMSAGSHSYDMIMFGPGGSLLIEDGTFLYTGDIMPRTGNTFSIGTPEQRIGTTGSVTIRLRDGAQIMPMGGALRWYGPTTESLTPTTRLTESNALSGTSQIIVEDVTGWKIGDTVVIAPSTHFPWETEEKTISSISGTTVTLDSALSYDHYGLGPVTWSYTQSYDNGFIDHVTRSVDPRAHVSNLTRPIRIECTESIGAHIMIMRDQPYPNGTHGGSAQIEGVEMYRLGIAEPSTYQSQIDNSEQPSPSGQGQPGRYSIHWHELYDLSNQKDYAKNCTTNRGRHKGFVVHDSNNVTLEDCVSYRGWSHQFSIGEDGTEKHVTASNCGVYYARRLFNAEDNNTYFGNDFAFYTLGPLGDGRIAGKSDQNEIHPGAFWITTPSSKVENCFVAGGLAMNAFYYDFYLGRKDLPDQETIILNESPYFKNNIAYAITPEDAQTYGTPRDVNQGICQFNKFNTLSYRGTGFAFWMDQYHDSREFIFDGLECFNVSNALWCESPSSRLKNFYGFHMKSAGLLISGFIESSSFVHNSQYDVMGISADNRNPASHPDFGNGSTYYEGFIEYESLCGNLENADHGGFQMYTPDNNNGGRAQKWFMSFKDVHLKGFARGFSFLQQYEGPCYLSYINYENVTTKIVSDAFASPDPNAASSAVNYDHSTGGIVRSKSGNKYNGMLYDLDTQTAYYLDGTTGPIDRVWLRAISPSQKLGIIKNKNDNAQTWFTTDPSPFFKPLYDRTSNAILAKNSNNSVGVDATNFQFEVFGLNAGDGLIINGQRKEYSPTSQFDGFNTLYLRAAPETSSVVISTSQPITSSFVSGPSGSFIQQILTCTNNSCTII